MTLPGDIVVGDPYSPNTDIVIGDPIFLGITTITTQTGSGSNQFVLYNQTTPLATWTITHTFGRPPSVTIFDSNGSVIITDIEHSNATTVVLTFAQPMIGKALLV